MPITLLHFGLIPLLNRVTRRRMSELGFVLASVAVDIPVVLQVLAQGRHDVSGSWSVGTLHSVFTHNFTGAVGLGLVLGLLRFKSAKWWLGCVLGTLTHVGLDMFVHSDVQPFMPWMAGNPFYMDGAHAVMSIALCFGLAFLVLDFMDSRKSAQQLAAGGPGAHRSKLPWWR